ncbi:hypothetical protein B0H19DRAFT_1275042 [Mycena capillaripes]|nr:hypothetical protein B0H19DRAFT_1275042 [Mycena capillaripes]
MPRDTANNESEEQFHQRLLSIGAADAEDQLSVDDFTLRLRLVADRKAAAIRKAEEERAAEVERLCKVAEGKQRKKERLEKREAKKRQEEEEKRKAGDKGKEKEAGLSGAGKGGRPIGPRGDSSDEEDEAKGELSKPKKKKAKKVDAGAEFPVKCESCEKKGIPCLRPESNKGHASKIRCSLGLGGAVSGPAGSTEIVDTLARFEQEFVAHNHVMDDHEKKMRELVRVNQARMETAMGHLTMEVHTLARAVTELGRLAAAYMRVHHPDVVLAYREDLGIEKKEKGKGKEKEPEVEDRREGPSGSA